MKIDHIRTFLEIARCGSFNRAAEKLNVTQSSVSGRIRLLEEHFGSPLFNREHSGVSLTLAGQRFHQYAEGIQRFWQEAHQEVTLPDSYKTTLSLGAQVSLWERLILDWMPLMRKAAPDVALNVQADYSTSLMHQLSEGLLDIGVMYQPRQVAGLVIEDLFEETLVMVASSPRSVSFDWVEDYVFIDWGETFRTQHSEAFPDVETPAVLLGLGAVGLQYILNNGGSGYFPIRVVEPFIEEGRLFLVDDAPSMSRPAYVVYAEVPKDEEVPRLALELLKKVAGQH